MTKHERDLLIALAEVWLNHNHDLGFYNYINALTSAVKREENERLEREDEK
jgi:hypothetical protein